MANLLISGVFSKTQDGKDGVVRQFKSAVSDAVKRHDGKMSQFGIDNGVITISIDDEAVANKLKDELKDLEGATVTVVGSALEALVGRLNSQKSARAEKTSGRWDAHSPAQGFQNSNKIRKWIGGPLSYRVGEQ
jgi:chloramphenicol 3-O-phosphotransferase